MQAHRGAAEVQAAGCAALGALVARGALLPAAPAGSVWGGWDWQRLPSAGEDAGKAAGDAGGFEAQGAGGARGGGVAADVDAADVDAADVDAAVAAAGGVDTLAAASAEQEAAWEEVAGLMERHRAHLGAVQQARPPPLRTHPEAGL
jgi:hypothetical protein